MTKVELTSSFYDEASRIQKSSGQAIFGGIAHFAAMMRSAGMTDNADDNAVFNAFGNRFGFSTEADLLAKRENDIQAYIEGPCQPLARALMDKGMSTISSNAYNEGPKGIFWETPEGERFFTSILNGRTYKDTGTNRLSSDFNQEVEGPDVSHTMPDGWDPDALIIG